MKNKPFAALLLGLLSAFNLQPSTFGQGTAFTYQGRLIDGAAAANGTYDLRFTLYDALTSGSAVAGPLTNAPTSATNGLFTATLDFGASAFPGAARWLEIDVRTNGSLGPYSTLSPRQTLNPSPYAITAGDATSANLARLNAPNTAFSATGHPVVTSGFITSALVDNPGAGYVSPPTVTVNANGPGAGAVVTATVSGGSVAALNVMNAGSGYSLAATLTIGAAAPNNGQTFISSNYFSGPNTFGGAVTLNNAGNSFTGNGAGLTALNASQLVGTVADGRLSTNVALLNASQTFSGINTFADARGNFRGNGGGLSNLNLTLNSGGAIQQGAFSLSASSPSVGTGPVSVTSADVNGDGRLDLIGANYGGGSGNTLTVLTNDGSGGFVLASSPAVGTGPGSVVATDVNGDGQVDLISANFNANTLTVLTNNGSGGFVLASSPGVGTGPASLVAADVNGDGKIDLISANYIANTLTVLTNNGSGGFVLASSPVAGNGPYSLVAADVNGDGWLDLITANLGGNTLTILTNNRSGGFVLASSPNVGNGPISVTAADVNGDGRSDLICANSATNTLTVLTNNGSGGFGLASSPGAGNFPISVVAADVNGDGRVDLITANFDASTLSVLTNNGSGGFALASSPAVGSGPNSLVAADVNGDGRMDLISVNRGANTLSVLFNLAQFNGVFTGSGAGLSGINLDATNISSGTLADARLSANVALRAGGNAFTGQQTIIGGNVGIGTTVPLRTLQVGNVATPASEGMIHLASRTSSGGGSLREWELGVPQTGDDGSGEGYSFVIRDTTAAPTTARLFIKWGSGNVGIGTSSPSEKLHVNGNILASGTITPNSDRNAKTDFAPVDSAAVLAKVAALPILQWRFKTEEEQVKHLGPMAQDFRAAFGLGAIPTAIATVDADGVALAAIQGLNQKLEQQLEQKETELTELKQRMGRLERMLNEKNGSAR